MRAAVFSCLGLGDGLISLVLSNNLAKNGWEVTTYHPFLSALQEWFPHLPLAPFPLMQEMEEALSSFDRLFIFYEKSERMLGILSLCQRIWPGRLTVLNPIATLRHDYPFWENGKFEGHRTFVENLVNYCGHSLRILSPTASNGITLPKDVVPGRFPKRVVIHPLSSRPHKNWPWKRFSILAKQLESQGFDPWFILTAEEKKMTPICRSPNISTLSETARFVAESGSMIGNDSGIGHLASCLGLPAVTICRHRQASLFWRPAWSPGAVLTPPKWIPNIKRLRWRDRYWQHFIPVKNALKAFLSLQKSNV